ncbi:MAG TPA: succinyl-diaminopimelate desuccinylase [Acidimicrobiales bacterium]|nr:succinyl-diaminopimelate desuccinylase [Acidimicrobiales bacterium]
MSASGDELMARCAELVDIPSVSHNEKAITDHVERLLREVDGLDVERVGDNVVARTDLGRPQRLILAGHTDTVPVNGNDRARIDGDTLWGLGSADMKAGCTVFLELARRVTAPSVDLTFVFYACEEVGQEDNGLVHLLADRPDLLAGDAAILGEPTGARVEAGCQGTLRAEVVLAGERAHTARPWMGRNAVHRVGPILERLADYTERRPVLNGCEYREAVQAVRIEGFAAYNVVPDRVALTVNHRFAPDRSIEEAFAHVRDVIGPTVDEAAGDTVTLVDAAAPAPPSLDHPLIAALVVGTGEAPRAKLGWTDVSFFSARGIPATNYGPGEPTVAHTAGEHVTRDQLEAVYATVLKLTG